MFHVLFENHIYYIADISETHYVSYDDEGKVIYIPSVKRDTSLIPTSQLPKGLVRLFDENGKEYPDMMFSTDDPTPRTLRFHLEAGELKSKELEIQIRPLPTEDYEELEIPIIFHVMQQPATPGVPTINIDTATVYKHINRMNKVFAGLATTDPNGWNAKIKFVPAVYDNSGVKLDCPGVHYYDIPSSVVFEKDDKVTPKIAKQGKFVEHNGVKYLEVGECSGFDDEMRNTFSKNKEDFLFTTIEVKANEIFKDTGGK